jgi:hypothetical protein
MSSLVPTRPERDLADDERRELEAAHHELRKSVAAYEVFLATEIQTDKDAPRFDADELAAAQERVETAERALWELREQFLGWARPSWAPSATLVSDWILEEDAGYDVES